MRLSLLTLALMAAVAPAGAANLSEIYRLALQNDPVYAGAVATAQAGKERKAQGLAGLRPTVQAGANARRTNSENSATTPTDRTYSSHGWSLSLVQPLFRKQNLETYEQGKLQSLLAGQQLQLAGQDLILRVARAYFDLLQAEDNLTTAQSETKALAEQLAQARRSFEVGVVTIVDAHEAQARHDLATAREIAARNDLEVKRRALEKLINSEAPQLDKLREQAGIVLPEPNNMDAWAKQAQESSLSVIASQTAREISSREVEKQRGARYPTLDLSASYNDNRNTSFGNASADTKTASLGLELGWVPYQGGAVSSRIREAVANLEKSRQDLENARRQSTLDARQAYLGVISGDAQAKALGAALVSSESQLKSTLLGLEVGVRTRVDVLNAQQQLSTTKRDLAATRYSAIVNGLALKGAAGTLSEEDLKAIDGLLQPR